MGSQQGSWCWGKRLLPGRENLRVPSKSLAIGSSLSRPQDQRCSWMEGLDGYPPILFGLFSKPFYNVSNWSSILIFVSKLVFNNFSDESYKAPKWRRRRQKWKRKFENVPLIDEWLYYFGRTLKSSQSLTSFSLSLPSVNFTQRDSTITVAQVIQCSLEDGFSQTIALARNRTPGLLTF